MRDRQTLIRSLHGAYRRATAPLKSRLDRRYLTRAESVVMLSTLHDTLSNLRSGSRDQQDILVALEVELRERLVAVDAEIERLRIQTAENRIEAAKGSAFVAHEEPHALRKQLFESHRLAREGAEAIESLLQAELLLWQAIDAVNVSLEPESDGR